MAKANTQTITTKTALLLEADGKYTLTLHEDEQKANDAANAFKTFDSGWVISKKEDMSTGEGAMRLNDFNALLTILTGKKGEHRYLNAARDDAWEVLSVQLGHPASESKTEQVARTYNAGVGAGDGQENEVEPEPENEPAPEPQTGESPMATKAKKSAAAKPKAPAKKAAAAAAETTKPKAPAKTPPAAAAEKVTRGATIKKAKPAKAAKAANGDGRKERGGISDPWKKSLRELAKAGKEGLPSKDFAAIVEKNGVRPFWARFVRAGILEQVARGQYAVTKEGAKQIE